MKLTLSVLIGMLVVLVGNCPMGLGATTGRDIHQSSIQRPPDLPDENVLKDRILGAKTDADIISLVNEIAPEICKYKQMEVMLFDAKTSLPVRKSIAVAYAQYSFSRASIRKILELGEDSDSQELKKVVLIEGAAPGAHPGVKLDDIKSLVTRGTDSPEVIALAKAFVREETEEAKAQRKAEEDSEYFKVIIQKARERAAERDAEHSIKGNAATTSWIPRGLSEYTELANQLSAQKEVVIAEGEMLHALLKAYSQKNGGRMPETLSSLAPPIEPKTAFLYFPVPRFQDLSSKMIVMAAPKPTVLGKGDRIFVMEQGGSIISEPATNDTFRLEGKTLAPGMRGNRPELIVVMGDGACRSLRKTNYSDAFKLTNELRRKLGADPIPADLPTKLFEGVNDPLAELDKPRSIP